jgi:3' terminal RNA ribose 2'-O-methyltransferase Hen1
VWERASPPLHCAALCQLTGCYHLIPVLLTITNRQSPATDLGFLLHKHPNHLHKLELSFGNAYVFYPEASDKSCTAALLLDIDPIGLVRNRRGPAGEGGLLAQYVNDRPYAASSFLSVALARVFGTAMSGRSKSRQELADSALPLSAHISALPSRGGEQAIRGLFEPLGYTVHIKDHVLDANFPEWGSSPYFTVDLSGKVRLQDLLSHLYVLIPVLDAEKHYWVGDDEVEKLLRRGEGWLASHPAKEMIVRRYLKHRSHLTREALARLADEDQPDPEAIAEKKEGEEAAIEAPLKLWEQRIGAVISAIRSVDAKRVLDLGCGEGKLLKPLLAERHLTELVGMDVSYRSLEIAAERLNLDRLPSLVRERVRLLHGSLMYRDSRLARFDAACVIEVIEHLDAPRLAAFERVLFEHARPKHVVLTTPNSDYNVRFATLPAGQFRHKDHRFEWTRAQFAEWASSIQSRFGYSYRILSVGPDDPEVGPPTQMGVFSL